MNIEELQTRVKRFEKQAGFDKTEAAALLKMLKEETEFLERNLTNPASANHQITDLLILLMQLASRYDTHFAKEIEYWFEKSKKYL